MITSFVLNKDTDEAILEIGGKGFHKNLHTLCQVIPPEDRHFNGYNWRIRNPKRYAEMMIERWPEFTTWVRDFEKQLELPINGA